MWRDPVVALKDGSTVLLLLGLLGWCEEPCGPLLGRLLDRCGNLLPPRRQE